VSYNVRPKSILQTVTTEFSGVAVKKSKWKTTTKMIPLLLITNHTMLGLVGSLSSLTVLTLTSQRLIPIDS
jgi:hypothetical protein